MISKRQSKFIKSLKIKKYRDAESAFLVEGRKNVLELLESGFKIKFIVCSTTFKESNIHSLKGDFDVFITSAEELAKLGTFKVNSECIAVVQKRSFDIKKIDLKGITFLLDDISDPGNLGTIIRTLDWFGFHQVICSTNTADLYNPKVINSSMGSFTRIKVYYTDLVALIAENKLPVYGTDMNGTPLTQLDFPSDAMIAMGSESHGLSKEVRSLVTSNISIPGYGKAESLNVGIATGIICHHIKSY